jgi:hypothetical protein
LIQNPGALGLSSDLDPLKLRFFLISHQYLRNNQCFSTQGYSKIEIFQKKIFFGSIGFPLRKTEQGVVDGGCDPRMNFSA